MKLNKISDIYRLILVMGGKVTCTHVAYNSYLLSVEVKTFPSKVYYMIHEKGIRLLSAGTFESNIGATLYNLRYSNDSQKCIKSGAII